LGATQAGDGQKRLGANRYDSVAGFGARTGTDYLNFDFDNGTGGTGLGEREAMTARGDSGGPGFIDWQIAGVTSWGDNGSAFGANGGMARVSTSQNFIDGILNQPDDIVIDLNRQESSVWGNSVVVWRGPSDLWLKVNGAEAAIPLSQVRSLRILGTDGNDTIQFKGDVLDQAFSVRVDAGLGNDTLQAPDTWNRWELKGGDWGMLCWDVPFTSVENLRGGSSGDAFYVSPGARVSGSIDGGFGDMPDSIHYDTWTTGVSVNLSTGLATAVGGTLLQIENAWGGEGRDTLIGNSMNNVLVGNGDVDRLEGGAGEDWLVGGAGNDTLDGGNDGIKDHLYGGLGQDTFVTHYNPFVKAGSTAWFPEMDDTDYDSAADVTVRRYW
jgi:hypothetical protein